MEPAADRPDPVALLSRQDVTREPDLVPVRHGRMMASPFTFYRGAAAVMAADLKDTPVAGLGAQLCGDAHLSNFGLFASPERRLLFDLNDFDETLPGPFEFDVKRMAASFMIAGRNNGFSRADARAATRASATAYREAMAEFAQMPTMDIWYAHLDEDELMRAIRKRWPGRRRGPARSSREEGAEGARRIPSRRAKLAKLAEKRAEKTREKAHTRDSLQALSKLGELVDGRYRIVSQPPVIVPARDLAATYGLSPEEVVPVIHDQFRAYRATLQDDRRHLLERFHFVDVAPKVVGVGSVGIRAFIVLLQGPTRMTRCSCRSRRRRPRSWRPPAQEPVPPPRRARGVWPTYDAGSSDIYLGWTKGLDMRLDFYWRQLRDMKGSTQVEAMTPPGLTLRRICGWTLARAHARSGDPVAIAEYLGASDAFDTSITDFSERYADQNERDYEDS